MLVRSGSRLIRAISFTTLLRFRFVCFSLSDICMKYLPNDFLIGIKQIKTKTLKTTQTKSRLCADITFRSHGIVNEIQMAPRVPPAAIKGNSSPAFRESIISFARVQKRRKIKILVT